jgi:hypothetical protein
MEFRPLNFSCFYEIKNVCIHLFEKIFLVKIFERGIRYGTTPLKDEQEQQEKGAPSDVGEHDTTRIGTMDRRIEQELKKFGATQAATAALLQDDPNYQLFRVFYNEKANSDAGNCVTKTTARLRLYV